MSQAETTGVFIGLLIGVVEYFIVLFVMQKVVTREMAEAREAKEDLPGINALAAIVAKIKWIMILVAILVYPAIGYLAGRYLAG